jgi:hypothetical protein
VDGESVEHGLIDGVSLDFALFMRETTMDLCQPHYGFGARDEYGGRYGQERTSRLQSRTNCLRVDRILSISCSVGFGKDDLGESSLASGETCECEGGS